MWHATYLWKDLGRGLQLFFKPHLNERFSQEVMALHNVGSANFGNFKTLNLGGLGQNDI